MLPDFFLLSLLCYLCSFSMRTLLLLLKKYNVKLGLKYLIWPFYIRSMTHPQFNLITLKQIILFSESISNWQFDTYYSYIWAINDQCVSKWFTSLQAQEVLRVCRRGKATAGKESETLSLIWQNRPFLLRVTVISHASTERWIESN